MSALLELSPSAHATVGRAYALTGAAPAFPTLIPASVGELRDLLARATLHTEDPELTADFCRLSEELWRYQRGGA